MMLSPSPARHDANNGGSSRRVSHVQMIEEDRYSNSSSGGSRTPHRGERGLAHFAHIGPQDSVKNSRRGSLAHEAVHFAQEAVAEREKEEHDLLLCGCIEPPFDESLEHSSLFILNGDNRFRQLLVVLVKSRGFELFVILLIISNTVFLALDDPAATTPPSYQLTIDVFYTTIFTLEMVLKVIAFGFVGHPGAYLQVGWNRLDFLIVLLMYVSLLPGVGNFTALRVLRVFRPLRSLTAVRGLKILVSGLIHSIGGLGNVVMLSMIIFATFGILGVQLWMGKFSNHCIDLNTNRTIGQLCSSSGDDMLVFGIGCPAGTFCGEAPNPEFGFMNFDDFRWGFLVIFQIMTLEAWSDILLNCERTIGFGAFLYFFFLTLITGYFLPNLALAVINDKYNEAQRAQDRNDEEQLARDFEEERLQQLEAMKKARKAQRDLSRRELEGVKENHHLGSVNPLETPSVSPGVESLGSITHSRQLTVVSLDVPAMSHSRLSDVESGGALLSAAVSVVHSPPRSPHVPAILIEGMPLASPALSAAVAINSTPKPFSDHAPLFGHGGDVHLGQEYEQVSSWRALRNALHLITQGVPLPAEDEEAEESRFTPFVLFIVACIVLNTLVLASQYYDQPAWMDTMALYTNYVFTGIFGVEMFLNLAAIGFKRFFTDFFYVLDFLVVGFSLVDIFLTGTGVITVFRALRLLRVLKLLRNFPSLRALIKVILTAVADTLYVAFIMCLFLTIAALTGKQLFGTALDDFAAATGNGNGMSYRNFYRAFLTVFQCITTDGWVDAMHYTMIAVGPWSSVFYLVLMIIGVYVIMNLFLSILISGFEKQGVSDDTTSSGADGDDSEGRMAFQKMIDRAIARTNHLNMIDSRQGSPVRLSTGARAQLQVVVSSGNFHGEHTMREELGECPQCHTQYVEVLSSFPGDPQPSTEELHAGHCFAAHVRSSKNKVLSTLAAYCRRMADGEVAMTASNVDLVFSQAHPQGLLRCVTRESIHNSWDELLDEIQEEFDILDLKLGEEQLGRTLVAYTTSALPKTYYTNGGDSLFIFGPTNAFRVEVSRLVRSKTFDAVILIIILLSSLTLVFDNPRSTWPQEMDEALTYSNYVFVGIFTVEMILKLIAFGAIGHQGSYFRQGWNVLDAFIVFTSILAIFLGGAVSSLRAIRTLRALRPLRVVQRNKGLRIIVVTLFQSIKGISYVAMLALLNYLIWGILGVQLLGGNLQTCTDSTVTTRAACVGSFFNNATNITDTRRWQSPDRNFDNIFRSMLILFQVSAADNWGDVMYTAMNSVSDEVAPQTDANQAMGLFFVGFFVISNLFMLNLFVAVVIFNFNNVKDRLDGLSLLTEEQKNWIEAQHMMLNFRPEVYLEPLANAISRKCDAIISTVTFDLCIALAIVLNVVVIATEYQGQPTEMDQFQSIANMIFVGIFALEALMKLTAHGCGYFRVSWNRFDCVLVVIGIVTVVVANTLGTAGANPGVLSLLRMLRIVRVLRVLRLFKQARTVRVLIETLWFSLPSIGNISLFMVILLFVFGVVGCQSFSNVRPGLWINDDYFNYHNLASSMHALFVFTTNEGWSNAMYDCMTVNPDCTDGCGDSTTSAIFHVTFMVISAFVVANLFIAIILDNFATTMRMDQSQLSLSALHRYTEIWGEHDRDGTMLLPTSLLPELLAELQPPLGIARRDSRAEILSRLSQYRIPEHNGMVHFVEVLIPLASAASGVCLSEREVRRQQQHVRATFPELQSLPAVRYYQAPVHVGHFIAQSYVASAFRGQRTRRQIQELRAAKIRAFEDALAECRPDDPFAPSYRRRLKRLKRYLSDHSTDHLNSPLLSPKTRAAHHQPMHRPIPVHRNNETLSAGNVSISTPDIEEM